MLANAFNFLSGLLEATTKPKNTTYNNILLLWVTLLVTISLSKLILNLASKRSRTVYLLDFACHKPKSSQRVTKESTIERMMLYGNLTKETLNFSKKLLERSGLGQSTYMADGLLKRPPSMCMAESKKEVEAVAFQAVEEVLRKTGVKADEIGIVVTNCSIFNPVPSLSCMIVNRFKMRKDVVTYNLSGMGCSAGLAAIGLVKQLLQVHENTYALVVSTESVTENGYLGNNRPMIVINCFFRVGGAAILLTNCPTAATLAKYRLSHTVHTHTAGSNPPSYICIYQEEDSEGVRGVTITKDLLACASWAIQANLVTLGPLILPFKAQFLYLARKLLASQVKSYVPNFKETFEHFFPHVGGKPVLDELARSLKLTELDMEASRMTLYRFGNTSSSSIWYELAYTEAKGRVKKGDQVWQVAFGSGFKCSSVIWKANRSVREKEVGNPWTDEIDEFPMEDETDSKKAKEAFPYFLRPVDN